MPLPISPFSITVFMTELRTQNEGLAESIENLIVDDAGRILDMSEYCNSVILFLLHQEEHYIMIYI